jgi:hypothetical protein
MNPRTTPTIEAPPSSLAARQDQSPYTAFTHDFQELCSRAMDRAIGMEQASFDAVLHMQSCVMEACDVSVSKLERPSCVAPAFGNLFVLMAQTITSLMELQLAWLTMMAPHAAPKTDTAMHVPASERKVATNAASNLRTMPQTPVELLAHSMDIAIGAHAA